VQNALIAQGYVTSKVVAAPQSLQTGTLALSVQWGTIRQIQWAPLAATEVRRASQWNTLPMGPGNVLNLRDIEQALENFKRVPTAQADIQILPGADPGTSDLLIRHSQPFPFRVNLAADDSGTPSTGKFQGNATLSYDNALTLSDLFYVTLNHDLGGSDAGYRGNRGRTVHYSVPYGFWTLALTASHNQYHQTVAGATQTYIYSGTSQNTEAKLSRIIQRDSVGKTSISLKGFQRKSNNYIDDTEVEVQRRVVGGYELGLNHKRAMGQATLEGNLASKRGTGAWSTQAAPEEAFGEGTSRMQLWLADANINLPFTAGQQNWTYNGSWRAQFNRTPLTPQDRMAIAGRYSVRGFDGLNILSAERGWVIRNEIVTPTQAPLQFYAGIDYGQVNGPSAATLVGNRLTGGVLGVRGQAQKFQYDVFIGAPIQKPDRFKTSSYTAGFSVSMGF
jgi:hemolysin activation/secretion protein